MSRKEKLILKLLNPGAVLTFHELESILFHLGYIEKTLGKTAGSRKAYVHEVSMHIIRIHKPHPQNEIKFYIKNYIISELKNQNLI